MTDWKGLILQAYENRKKEGEEEKKKGSLIKKKINDVYDQEIMPALRECEKFLASQKINAFYNKDHKKPCIGVEIEDTPEWVFTIENDGNTDKLNYSTKWGLRSTTGIIEPVTKDQILFELAESLNKVCTRRDSHMIM